MGKSKGVSASVLVGAVAWLVAVGAILTLSLWATADRRCIQVAGGGDGGVYLITCLGHCRRDCMACYHRRSCHVNTIGDCR
jgi:hypothetical protein